MDELRHIIQLKRELVARDTFSRPTFDCSKDMSEDRKSRYISYLVDRVNEVELDKNAMELVLEDFLHSQQEMKAELAELRELRKSQEKMALSLSVEIRKRKNAEVKSEKLKAQLDFAQKNKFGNKQQKVTRGEDKQSVEETPDRNDEQEKFDGTEYTLETKSVSESSDAPAPKKEKKRDLCNRPDTYNVMGIQGAPVEHPSDNAKVPGRILDRKIQTKAGFGNKRNTDNTSTTLDDTIGKVENRA